MPEKFAEMKEKREAYEFQTPDISQRISRIKIQANKYQRLSRNDDRFETVNPKDAKILKTLERERNEIKSI